MAEREDRRPLVAIVGDGSLADDSPKLELACQLGGSLVDAGYRILCGGRGGVMEAACRGARGSEAYREGDTVGVLPGGEAGGANAFVDVVLPTRLSHGRNFVVAQADAVVAIGGGAGTLTEIGFAWICDRLVIAFRVDGWSGALADRPVDARDRLPHIDDDRVYGVDTPGDAIEHLERLLPAYRKG